MMKLTSLLLTLLALFNVALGYRMASPYAMDRVGRYRTGDLTYNTPYYRSGGMDYYSPANMDWGNFSPNRAYRAKYNPYGSPYQGYDNNGYYTGYYNNYGYDYGYNNGYNNYGYYNNGYNGPYSNYYRPSYYNNGYNGRSRYYSNMAGEPSVPVVEAVTTTGTGKYATVINVFRVELERNKLIKLFEGRECVNSNPLLAPSEGSHLSTFNAYIHKTETKKPRTSKTLKKKLES